MYEKLAQPLPSKVEMKKTNSEVIMTQDVAATMNQRELTLIQRRSNVVCPVGRLWLM